MQQWKLRFLRPLGHSLLYKTKQTSLQHFTIEEKRCRGRRGREGKERWGGAACVDGCASEEEQKEKEEEGVQAGGGAGEEVEEEERNALGGWLMEIRGAAAEH